MNRREFRKRYGSPLYHAGGIPALLGAVVPIVVVVGILILVFA